MKKFLIAVVLAALAATVLAVNPGGAAVDELTDVPEGSFYEDAVLWAFGADVTTGTSDSTFSPDAQLTRKDGMTLLWRAAGSPGGNPDAGFTDVVAGSYYEEAVNWAAANEITTGVSSTEFGSDQPMTRAQFVTLLWRAAGSPTGNPDAGFTDVADGEFYTEAVNWAAANGITTGITPTTFGPDEALTRAQGITFLWRDNGAPTFSLNVFHMNDHHSHLESDDVDILVPSGEVEIELGGFSRVVEAIDYLRDSNSGENNVTIHAGDAITGTLFYTLFDGEADAAMMNEVCFDMFAIGNHEFDAGDEGLKTFLDFLNADPDCDTAALAANIRPAVGTPLAPGAVSDDYLMPYHIEHFGDDAVAFVGIDIKQKTEVSSQPLDSTVFLDEVATAQSVINELTAKGYNKIGLVTHQGLGNDLDLASMVDGVDFIVGGDSHTLVGDFDALGLSGTGDYPTITADMGGNTTCVVQAWQYTNVVGALNVHFDDDGNVTGCGGNPYLMFGEVFDFDDDGDDVVATQAEVDAVLAAAGQMQWDTDADADATLAAFAAEVDVLSLEVIGSTTDDLCLARFPFHDEGAGAFPPNDGRSAICDAADVPNGGEIQQQVTDAFLDRSFRGEIALQNSGGVRIDIPTGDITIADAYELLPFANTLIELDMTGAEILLALEQGLGNVIDNGGSSGAYPYGAGIRWDVDVTADFGERFSNVEVRPKGTGTWVAIDEGATYVVVANSFMAGGGDGYAVLAEVVADGRSVDTFLDYAQSWIDWLGENSPVGDPTEYSTQSYSPDPTT
ncbi:MAG: 5'-nucleotidase C-terminal domain-containing protein [Actinomycetota bacterium]